MKSIKTYISEGFYKNVGSDPTKLVKDWMKSQNAWCKIDKDTPGLINDDLSINTSVMREKMQEHSSGRIRVTLDNPIPQYIRFDGPIDQLGVYCDDVTNIKNAFPGGVSSYITIGPEVKAKDLSWLPEGYTEQIDIVRNLRLRSLKGSKKTCVAFRIHGDTRIINLDSDITLKWPVNPVGAYCPSSAALLLQDPKHHIKDVSGIKNIIDNAKDLSVGMTYTLLPLFDKSNWGRAGVKELTLDMPADATPDMIIEDVLDHIPDSLISYGGSIRVIPNKNFKDKLAIMDLAKTFDCTGLAPGGVGISRNIANATSWGGTVSFR